MQNLSQKNQDIFEEAEIEEWITSDKITDQYQETDDQIIDSVLNQAADVDDDKEEEGKRLLSENAN